MIKEQLNKDSRGLQTRNWANLGQTFKAAQTMTQLLSLAKELLKCIQNQRLKWKENQTIIVTDFTQICSPF